jgi:hypothetical protein
MDYRHTATKAVRTVKAGSRDAKALDKDPEWDRIEAGDVDDADVLPPGVVQPPEPGADSE